MKDSPRKWTINMSRGFWLYSLTLACALFAFGSLAALPGSSSAQSLTSVPAPKSHLALARAETGYPLGRGGPSGSHNKLPSDVGKPVGGLSQTTSCWTVAASPNPSSGYNSLDGVASVSPNDIWAVGTYCSSGCDTDSEVDSTLIEHYNGTIWSVVPSPNVGSDFNTLSGVAALSTKNVWAVGFYFDTSTNRIQTLTEHYDGTQWSVVPSVNPGLANNYLYAVAAISPNDIWALGNYRIVGGPFVVLAEHWNGSSWSVVSTPNPGLARDQLPAVTALAPNNVWAVGNACDTNDCFTSAARTLVEHWDGSSWSVVPSPNAGAGPNFFSSVSAARPNDIWAVGDYCADSDCNNHPPLIEHWNGTAWSVASGPNVEGVYWGVIAVSAKDVWAGGSTTSDGGNTFTNLLSHYDGRSWSAVSVTSPGAFDNNLRALTAIGPNKVWVVGDYDNGDGYRTQVQHYNGPCR